MLKDHITVIYYTFENGLKNFKNYDNHSKIIKNLKIPFYLITFNI